MCANTVLEGTFMCAPSFLVCARLMACVQLRRNLGADSLDTAYVCFGVVLFLVVLG